MAEYLLTTNWNQGNPYNLYCPEFEGIKTLTGCVATACSQIIYYWLEQGYTFDLRFTETDKIYLWDYYNQEGFDIDSSNIQTYCSVTYDELNQILASYRTDGNYDQNKFIAALNLLVGARGYFAYETDLSWGTNGYGSRDLFTSIGFESVNAHWMNPLYYGDGGLTEIGFQILGECIADGQVIYTDMYNPAHAAVIDGYDPVNQTMHLNMGWGGSRNGWYTRSELNALALDLMMFDLYPVYDGETITITNLNQYGEGSFHRSVELTNGIQVWNQIEFAPELTGKTINLLNSAYYSISSPAEFINFNANLFMEQSGSDYATSFRVTNARNFSIKDFSGSFTLVNEIDDSDSEFISYNTVFSIENTAFTLNEFTGTIVVNTAAQMASAIHFDNYSENDYKFTMYMNGGGIFAGDYSSSGQTRKSAVDAIRNALNQYSDTGIAVNPQIAAAIDDGFDAVFADNGEAELTLDNRSVIIGNVNLGNDGKHLTILNESLIYGDIEFASTASQPEEPVHQFTIDTSSAVFGNVITTDLIINILVNSAPEERPLFTSTGRFSYDGSYRIRLTDQMETGIYHLSDDYNISRKNLTWIGKNGTEYEVRLGVKEFYQGYSVNFNYQEEDQHFTLTTAVWDEAPLRFFKEEKLTTAEHSSNAMINNSTGFERAEVASGGNLQTATVQNGGKIEVFFGGKVTDSIISGGGNVFLNENASAEGTIINANGGLHVYSGATARNTTVNQSGYFGVGNGAATYGTTIGYAGALTVWSGGRVTDNTINTWGAIILSSGAAADSSVINATGGLHVYSGAVASNTIVKQDGFFGVGRGAETWNTTIDYAGELTVWGGGVVHSNEINQWGAIILSSGAAAETTVINPDGGLHIFRGAAAYTTTVTSGARLGIGGGGLLYNANLENTATMTFYEGAKLGGWIDAEGLIITSGGVDAQGAFVNFELGERSADQGVILDDMAKFYSVRRYSVEVETDQAAGTYQLAGGAEHFTGSLSLYIGNGNDCGMISVDTALDHGGKHYSLLKNNGILSLQIT